MRQVLDRFACGSRVFVVPCFHRVFPFCQDRRPPIPKEVARVLGLDLHGGIFKATYVGWGCLANSLRGWGV